MPDKFTQLLPALGALVAFLVAAVLVLYIFRLLFGRRIRSPGGRNRARRLDVVDVFDLDRERQLVIVRRDNTEHLLLIGGPNDILVEAAIERLESALVRAPEQRAVPPAAAGWPAGPSAPKEPETTLPKPAAAAVNLPPDLFAPAPAKPAGPPPPPPQAPPGGPRISSPAAPPPRPAPPRSPTPPFLARAQQRFSPRPKEQVAPSEAAAPAAPNPPSGAPRPVEPPPGPKPAAPPPPAPPAATRPAAPPPAAPPPSRPGAPPPPPPPAAPPEADPLDSLEAEMARLLGRPDEKK